MGVGLTAAAEEDGQLRLDTENVEEIRHVQSQVAIVLGNRNPEQPGTLYITTKRLIWLNDENKQHGYSVDFLSISLHAVSRDPEAYPLPCIYAQIENTETDGYGYEELEDENSTNDEDLDLSQVTEISLVPSDSNTLDDLFKVLCACAELNPEPDGEVEGEGDWIFSAEDMANSGLLAEVEGEGDWIFSAEDMVNSGLLAEVEGEGDWIFSAEDMANSGLLAVQAGEDFEYDEGDMANPIGYSNGFVHNLPENILELRIDDKRFEDALEMEDETQRPRN